MPQAALNQAPNPTQTDDSFGSSLPQPDSCLSTYLVCLQTKQQRRWKFLEAYASQRGKFTERQFVNDRFGVHQKEPTLRGENRLTELGRWDLPHLSWFFLQNDWTRSQKGFYKMIGPALKTEKNSYKFSVPNKLGPMRTKWLSYLQNEGIQGKRFLRKRPSDNSSKDRVISHSLVGISRGLWSGFCSYKGLGQAGLPTKDLHKSKVCVYKMMLPGQNAVSTKWQGWRQGGLWSLIKGAPWALGPSFCREALPWLLNNMFPTTIT